MIVVKLFHVLSWCNQGGGKVGAPNDSLHEIVETENADTLELSSNVAGLHTACNMMLATSAALNSKFHEHLGMCFLA